MTNTLPEVKKELKALISKSMKVTVLQVHLEEYGEGYDTHVYIRYMDENGENTGDSWVLAEEEKIGKATARGERVTQSLLTAGFEITFKGVVGA